MTAVTSGAIASDYQRLRVEQVGGKGGTCSVGRDMEWRGECIGWAWGIAHVVKIKQRA